MFGMSIDPEIPRSTLEALLKHVDSGGFKAGCEQLGLDEIVAMDALVANYQSRSEKIVQRIIEETDPADLDSIHIGNYAQKADVLRTIGGSDPVTGDLSFPRHVLIFGDPGVGKSSFVEPLSRRFEVVTVNASINRTRNQLAAELQGMASTESVDQRQKIIFLDEVDSLSKEGTTFVVSLIGPGIDEARKYIEVTSAKQKKSAADRSSEKKMKRALHVRSVFPIVMCCNSIDKVSDRIKKSSRVKMIKFTSPNPFEIEALLNAYADEYWGGAVARKNKKLQKSDDQIKHIVSECNGDVRTAKSMMLGGEKIEGGIELRPIDIAYDVFVLDDRNLVYKILQDMKFSIQTILGYLVANLMRYYDRLSEIMTVSGVISSIDELKYKIRKEYVSSVIAFSIPPSRFKEMTPVYPKFKRKMKNGKEKEN